MRLSPQILPRRLLYAPTALWRRMAAWLLLLWCLCSPTGLVWAQTAQQQSFQRQDQASLSALKDEDVGAAALGGAIAAWSSKTIDGWLNSNEGGGEGSVSRTPESDPDTEQARRAALRLQETEQKQRTISTVGALAGISAVLAGYDAKDAQTAQGAAENVTRNNYLKHKEAVELGDAKKRFIECNTEACRATERLKIQNLEALSQARDQALREACTNPSTPKCIELNAELQAAKAEYEQKRNAPYGNMYEFEAINGEREKTGTAAQLYGQRVQFPGTFNTAVGVGQSFVDLGVGLLKSGKDVATMLLELNFLAEQAQKGSVEAQDKLRLFDQALLERVKDLPNVPQKLWDAVVGQWQKIQGLEATGRSDEAQQLRAKFYTDAATILSPAASAAASKLGLGVKFAGSAEGATLSAEARALGGAGTNRPPVQVEALPWGSWSDYPKISVDGRTYAQIGDRLYTEHAVNRTQPSGSRYVGGDGESGSGQIYNGRDAGRSIPPSMVDYVIQNGTRTMITLPSGVVRTVHTSGTVQVITEQNGRLVVTVNPFSGGK